MTKAIAAKHLEHIAPELRALAVSIDDLELDPENHNTHDERSIKMIAASLREFGQLKPIVAQRMDGAKPVVRAGNGTVQGLRLNGKAYVACVFVDGDKAGKGFALVDNQSAKYSEIDPELTRELLAEVQFDDIELATITTDIDELIASIESEGIDDDSEDESDEEPEESGNSMSITMRYTEDDVDDIVTFLAVEDLEEKDLGKQLLKRIKTAVARRRK